MTPTLEGKIAAVKAKWGELDRPLTTPRIIEGWFSNLTPAEQALAVVCPVKHCEAKIGFHCISSIFTKKGYGPTHPERIALVSGDAAVPMQLSGVCSEHGHFHGASCRKCVVPEDVRIPSNRVSPADMERLMKLNDGIQQEESAREKVELPKLNEITSADVALRANRWTARSFDLIDEAEDLDVDISGTSNAHAGLEAEWDLIQRERQLLAALEEVEHQKLVAALNLKAHYGWMTRAESAEARVGELKKIIFDATMKLGGVNSWSPDNLVESCAEISKRFSASNQRITALESVVVELAKVLHYLDTVSVRTVVNGTTERAMEGVLNLPIVAGLLK